MKLWYVRDPEGSIEEHDSESAARESARGLLTHYEENAPSDGWPSDIDCLEWGELRPIESASIETTPAPDGSSFDELWSVHLEPVADDPDIREAIERITAGKAAIMAAIGDIVEKAASMGVTLTVRTDLGGGLKFSASGHGATRERAIYMVRAHDNDHLGAVAAAVVTTRNVAHLTVRDVLIAVLRDE